VLSAARRRATDATPHPAPSRLPHDLLDEVPVGALAVDGADEVTVSNTAAHRLGLVRGSFLVVPELRNAARSVRRDGVRRDVTLSLPAPGLMGTRVPLRAQLFLLGGDDVGIVVEDLTEAARVDAVRRDFVANVSHEIKTPVGAIALLAEALREAREDPAAVARFVDRISAEATRLSRLVQELLDLSRLQGGEPLPEMARVAVRELLDEAVAGCHGRAAEKDVAVSVACSTDAIVSGDRAQLVMAVVNLIDNAVNYSGNGTSVHVVARRVEDVIEIAVKDEGIGIARDELGRIFERFYRVDPARSRETGGTGLGLAIVKHVMNNHGGEVTVWSTPGVGSTFTLRLPFAAAGDTT
jgi:two-component system sensor histidine kinase SenX3